MNQAVGRDGSTGSRLFSSFIDDYCGRLTVSFFLPDPPSLALVKKAILVLNPLETGLIDSLHLSLRSLFSLLVLFLPLHSRLSQHRPGVHLDRYPLAGEFVVLRSARPCCCTAPSQSCLIPFNPFIQPLQTDRQMEDRSQSRIPIPFFRTVRGMFGALSTASLHLVPPSTSAFQSAPTGTFPSASFFFFSFSFFLFFFFALFHE